MEKVTRQGVKSSETIVGSLQNQLVSTFTTILTIFKVREQSERINQKSWTNPRKISLRGLIGVKWKAGFGYLARQKEIGMNSERKYGTKETSPPPISKQC